MAHGGVREKKKKKEARGPAGPTEEDTRCSNFRTEYVFLSHPQSLHHPGQPELHFFSRSFFQKVFKSYMHLPTSLLVTHPPSFCPANISVLVLLGVFRQMALTAEETQRVREREKRGGEWKRGRNLEGEDPCSYTHSQTDRSHFYSTSES